MSDPFLERVQRVVARAAGAGRTPPSPGPDTPLGEAGFWLDSVDLVEVIVACEHEFGVAFEGEHDLNPESLRTVRSLATMLRSKGAR